MLILHNPLQTTESSNARHGVGLASCGAPEGGWLVCSSGWERGAVSDVSEGLEGQGSPFVWFLLDITVSVANTLLSPETQ